MPSSLKTDNHLINTIMRKPKLITHYGYLSDKELATLASRTSDALRDNAHFPDLHPSFAEYEAVALDYLAKHGISSKGGSLQENREKNEAREALVTIMRRVAVYINNLTEVSSVQLSSGFHPVAARQGLPVPAAPAWARLRDSTRPAELLLEFGAVREAYQYELAIAHGLSEDGQPDWQSLGLVSNSRGNFHAPVADGDVYYFRVRAQNKRGTSAWSPVASLRARVPG